MNEKLKKRTEKLKDANEELEAFTYSISHDLRVPLRAIDGFFRILMEDYENNLDSEGKRLLNIIEKIPIRWDSLLMISFYYPVQAIRK